MPKVLAVMFESNHCPASIAYESARARHLQRSIRRKGVQVIAINPNNPKAVRLNELGYTDMTRFVRRDEAAAAFMKLPWPYLYDGETQKLVDEVRRGRDAAHLHLRPGSKAARIRAPSTTAVRSRQGRSSTMRPTRSTRCLRARRCRWRKRARPAAPPSGSPRRCGRRGRDEDDKRRR